MTQIKGTINYTLDIDPKGEEHGLIYENKMENDIAGIMIAAQVLTVQLGQWKEYKKQEKADKKKASHNIATIATGLRAIKPLMHSLLNTYDEFKEYQENAAKEQIEMLTNMGVLPKEESEEDVRDMNF